MPTVIPVSKIKSLFWAKTVVLSDQVKLQLDKDEQGPVKSVLKYYRCLRILGHAYAVVGQHKVPSKDKPGKDVTFAPLSINLKYPDTVLRIATASSLGPSELLIFLRQRDESTRARLVELVRQGYPQGEALSKAWSEFELSGSQLLPKGLPKTCLQPPQKRGSAPAVRSMGSNCARSTTITGDAMAHAVSWMLVTSSSQMAASAPARSATA